MKALKIILLDLKSYYPSPPYQLALLVAYACKESRVKDKIDFQFLEYSRESSVNDIYTEVLEAKADLIAISDYSWNHKKICDLLRLMSEDENLPKILLGGPTCSGKLGEEILSEFNNISVLVEGEPAFADICHSMVENPTRNPFINFINCTVRGDNGTVIRSNISHRIQLMSISHKLWFRKSKSGIRGNNEPYLMAFIHDFYSALCEKNNCCETEEENILLHEMVDYNMNISPKPSWKPKGNYDFEYDVHQI